jgi:hypothetical protein
MPNWDATSTQDATAQDERRQHQHTDGGDQIHGRRAGSQVFGDRW